MTLWMKAHILLAAIILWANHTNKLEPAVKKIEQKLGIPVYYAPNDSTEMDISNPYPIEDMPGQDTFNSQRENNENR
tara:strand:- start:1814 stop:2044 length:231 start_codon:yes stop_codon:yes gene_type:complete